MINATDMKDKCEGCNSCKVTNFGWFCYKGKSIFPCISVFQHCRGKA